jgi:hypothetical protein
MRFLEANERLDLEMIPVEPLEVQGLPWSRRNRRHSSRSRTRAENQIVTSRSSLPHDGSDPKSGHRQPRYPIAGGLFFSSPFERFPT